MKWIASRAALAALTLACASFARAVPIKFTFSGVVYATSVQSEDWGNQPASAEFLIETDALLRNASQVQVPSVFYADRDDLLNRTDPVLGNITIGSESFSLNEFTGGYGGILFNDDCAPPECGGIAHENWSILLNSTTRTGPGVIADGLMVSRTLAFSSFPADDTFDVDTVKPEDILTLPLLQLIGSYQEDTYDCQGGNCTQLSSRLANFSVDSVTRGVVSTAVPEPGTLGLLGAGLIGMLFTRRHFTAVRRTA